MHFSGPLACVRVWTFLEARYHNTLKTLPQPAAPTGPRTEKKGQEQPLTTTPALQYQRNLLQPTATYCNLLHPALAYQRPTNKYQDPLIWSLGLSWP